MTQETRAAERTPAASGPGGNGAAAEPAILVQGVTRSFTVGGSTVHALAEFDLTIRPGTFVALMGRSGSGKTTLLNMFGALDQPTTGEVYVNGRPLIKLSDNELTRLRR